MRQSVISPRESTWWKEIWLLWARRKSKQTCPSAWQAFPDLFCRVPCFTRPFVCARMTFHHLFKQSSGIFERLPIVLYSVLVSNPYTSPLIWMAQMVWVLIWKGDGERFSCLPRPHHKSLADMASLLSGCQWPIWWGSSGTYFHVRSCWSFLSY